MRILFLTSVDHPQMRLEAQCLTRGAQVTYIVVPSLSKRRFKYFFKHILGNDILSVLVSLLKLRVPPIPPLLYLYCILLAIVIWGDARVRNKKYDLIYAQWLFPAGLIGLILSKIIHCKVVCAIWGYDIQVVSGIKNYGIRGSLRILSKYVIRKSDVVIVNHQVHRMIAERLVGRGHANVIYVPPAIPDLRSAFDAVATEELKEKLSSLFENELNENYVILYSPALKSLYGILEFVKAIPKVISEVKNCFFVIVGEGELKDTAVKFVREMKVDDRVLFLGRVSHESMKALYKMSTVVCDLAYPGTGTTSLEALCFGKPVIGIRSPKALIEHEVQGFLVNRGDDRSLAKYLIEILNNNDLRKKLSKNARRTYEEMFSMEKRMKTMFEIFAKIS